MAEESDLTKETTAPIIDESRNGVSEGDKTNDSSEEEMKVDKKIEKVFEFAKKSNLPNYKKAERFVYAK